VHDHARAYLPEVAQAFYGLTLRPDLVQSRQEDGNQHCDNADHDEQFYQCKRLSASVRLFRGLSSSHFSPPKEKREIRRRPTVRPVDVEVLLTATQQKRAHDAGQSQRAGRLGDDAVANIIEQQLPLLVSSLFKISRIKL